MDIGAHVGDTTLPLGVAAKGGTVVAFEMGPPVEILRINARLNPQFNIDIYNVAITNHTNSVLYETGRDILNIALKYLNNVHVQGVVAAMEEFPPHKMDQKLNLPDFTISSHRNILKNSYKISASSK